jgi:hypothetical protein
VSVAPATLEDWRDVVHDLYRRRAEAFATASPQLLDDVYAAGSPLLTADRELAQELAGAGEVLRGFAPVVEEVTAAEPDGDRVRLDLVDSRPGYGVVAAHRQDGDVLRTATGRGAAPVRMVLVRGGDGWLIDSAERQG